MEEYTVFAADGYTIIGGKHSKHFWRVAFFRSQHSPCLSHVRGFIYAAFVSDNCCLAVIEWHIMPCDVRQVFSYNILCPCFSSVCSKINSTCRQCHAVLTVCKFYAAEHRGVALCPWWRTGIKYKYICPCSSMVFRFLYVSVARNHKECFT